MGLLTTSLIAAGAQVAGAVIGSKSANKAAGQQVDATNTAKAELRPIYEGNVARMDPYAQLGVQGVGQLRALGGYPAPPALPAGGSAAAPNVAIPLNPNNPANFGTVTPPMNMSDPRVQALARGGSLADIGGGGASAYGPPAGRTQPGGGSFAVPRGGTVTLMAPDGEVRDFPEAQAAQLEQQYQGQLRRV